MYFLSSINEKFFCYSIININIKCSFIFIFISTVETSELHFLLLQLTSQLITYEHEGNWSKALESYDLLVRSTAMLQTDSFAGKSSTTYFPSSHGQEDNMSNWKCYKGLMRSLQKTGCIHLLDTYSHGLNSQFGCLQNDSEFMELQVVLMLISYFLPRI